MSPKEQRRDRGSPKKQTASLRKDVQKAIDRVWPTGIVEMPFDWDDSYFHGVYTKLSGAFDRIPRTRLLEREAEVEPDWWDDSDPEEDLPNNTEPSRSYHVFFVSPDGAAFAYETEAETISEPEDIDEEFEEPDRGDDPEVSLVHGQGRTGWVVAVSLLAPFAAIELGR